MARRAAAAKSASESLTNDAASEGSIAAAAFSSTTAAGRRMLERRQTLRVHLCPPLPVFLRLGCWHTLSIRLSNEMGLFDSECFAAAAVGLVRISAVLVAPSRAAPLRISLRQAVELLPHMSHKEAEREGLGATELKGTRESGVDIGGLEHGGGLVRLHRGRAVVEARIDVIHSLDDGSDWKASKAVLLAEMVEPDESTSLGALSLPISVLPHPIGTTQMVEADGTAPFPAAPPGHTEDHAAVREALRPLLSNDDDDERAHKALDSVQGFRLLSPPEGATSPLPLILAESTSGICGRVWDSGVLLAAWIGKQTGVRGHIGCSLQSLRALELGSGVGVGGLAAAALGAKVLLTDLDDAVEIMEINAVANAGRCIHQPQVGALAWGGEREVVARLLERAWGSVASTSEQGGENAPTETTAQAASGVPLVLCSDVVYEPMAYEPLLCTMRHCAELGMTRTLMAHRSRHPDEHLFFESAARDFSMQLLLGPPFVPLGAPEGAEPVVPVVTPADVGSEATTEVDGSVIRIFEFRALA
jgi:predicted nicotinamide N-methyase